jgi:hypothetical protein
MSVAVSIGLMLTRLFFISNSNCHQFAKCHEVFSFIYLTTLSISQKTLRL